MLRQPLSWIALTVWLGGCAVLPPLPPATQLPSVAVSAPYDLNVEYTLGAEDVVQLSVYGQADLSKEVTVGTDGTFLYPFLGVVRAEGLTIRQLEEYLRRALSTYLVTPQVSASVVRYQSHRVQVVGEVQKPGMYTLQRPSTLIEILTAAGGPTPNAGWEVTVVHNRTSGSSGEPTQLDLDQLLAGELPLIRVYNGDTIYVSKAAFFYVAGEVKQNGRYRLERYTTVAKALTVAGGFTPFAAKTRLKVLRLIDGESREFQVSMNNFLQAGDHLIVPQSIF